MLQRTMAAGTEQPDRSPTPSEGTTIKIMADTSIGAAEHAYAASLLED